MPSIYLPRSNIIEKERNMEQFKELYVVVIDGEHIVDLSSEQYNTLVEYTMAPDAFTDYESAVAHGKDVCSKFGAAEWFTIEKRYVREGVDISV